MTGPRDDVDRIVQAWQRERPDLDVSPLEVLSRVSRIGKRVETFRKTAFKASGLESWEFDVLAALRRAGDPFHLSPKNLLQETLVSSGAMTHRLGKLEGKGLISRTSHPEDGRGVVVTLTAQGLAAIDIAFSTLIDAEHELLRSLPRADRESMTTALRALSLDVESR
jgi:DNA-binding MarR family transcriptional regulator